ncbi:hypothetical protein GCM10023185_02950 [Hymenobacter saemangeumensis]|uniref:Uncharacterized protein n=2 Tax=Hymenobacter saemangeumensis TaxID=1084522 RepID=A0ABP8HYV3_9BACT
MQPPPPAVAPFYKANVLLVNTSDSARAALRTIAGILQERGFAIEKIDYDLSSIITKPRAYTKSGSHSMHILAITCKTGLRLTGQWRGTFGTFAVEERAAITNNASKQAFAEIEAVGKAYPGGALRYDYQP